MIEIGLSEQRYWKLREIKEMMQAKTWDELVDKLYDLLMGDVKVRCQRHLLYCLCAAKRLIEQGFKYVSIDAGINSFKADVVGFDEERGLALVEVKVRSSDLRRAVKQIKEYAVFADFVCIAVPAELRDRLKRLLGRHEMPHVNTMVFDLPCWCEGGAYRRNPHKEVTLESNEIIKEIAHENTKNMLYLLELLLSANPITLNKFRASKEKFWGKI
ncbi:MAG: endonuclease NucS domain-containing protein [Candidatus Baldrarchaeia archaeon]